MRRKIISKKKDLKNIDVVVLCGGKGTRLSGIIGDVPKTLAPVGSKTFLDIFLNNLVSQGFGRAILSIGHLKEKIIKHCDSNPIDDFEIVFSEENTPLGTGGAIRRAKEFIKSGHFFIINGDVLHSNFDFNKFYENHLNKNALLSIALSKVDDVSDYASVEIGSGGRILDFKEKISIKKPGVVNSGIYLARSDIFDFMPSRESFSIERDFFPKILNHNCYGFTHNSYFIDIGTPERYEKIKLLFKI